MTPLKGKLIYKFLTRQDGQIVLPDTLKNRSTSSVVVAINSTSTEILVGDIIMHNMSYNNKARTFLKSGEEHKVMDVGNVYAKVVRGNIVPVNGYYLCKLVIPESIIANAYGANDCKSVLVAALPITNDLPLKIGDEVIISDWHQDMVQFNIQGEMYIFLKESHMVAKVYRPLTLLN